MMGLANFDKSKLKPTEQQQFKSESMQLLESTKGFDASSLRKVEQKQRGVELTAGDKVLLSVKLFDRSKLKPAEEQKFESDATKLLNAIKVRVGRRVGAGAGRGVAGCGRVRVRGRCRTRVRHAER